LKSNSFDVNQTSEAMRASQGMQDGRRNAGTAEPADHGVRSEAELARDDQ
jgi:hypothetical protein